MNEYDYTKWFASRLAQLRIQKGVSARDMSLSLGQSESYINKIESGKALPSMTVFFYICEYLNLTPSAFFDTNTAAPTSLNKLTKECADLSPDQLSHLTAIVQDMKKHK